MVEEAVSAKVEIRAVLASPALDSTERGRALRAKLADRVTITEATDAELAELSATEHPQGILAVIVPKEWTLDDVMVTKASVVVVLDAVQDPGNVGTIARTAWALGAAGLIALPGTAEITNPKTLRAMMGALFRLPIVAAPPERVTEWAARHQMTTM